MQEEGRGDMEKKTFASPLPLQLRNNGSSGDRKCDFVPNKNGRGRRHVSNGGSRIAEVNQSPRSASNSKWNRSYSDKRPRQRGYFGDRQREEVAEETGGVYDEVSSTGSRKSDITRWLSITYPPRESEAAGRHGWGRNSGGGRGRWAYKKLPRYNKELFLQASCQFVVREGGDYTEQAVNPDALVSWDMIELVKSFHTEPVTCPICLQVPFAGKITKCGHIYCWACVLHYLNLGDNNYRKCPICYDAVMAEDLKSVQLSTVTDYSVGDEIEMKLMRKDRGSVYVMPASEWHDREGKPMNMHDGDNTKFMKLLVASLEQIQREVIDQERIALAAQLADAEESEATFIEQAQVLLAKREASLKKVFKRKAKKKGPYIPGLVLTPQPSESSSDEEVTEQKQSGPVPVVAVADIPPSVSNVKEPVKPSTVYADAFEDKVLPESDGSTNSPDATSPSVEDESDGAQAKATELNITHPSGPTERPGSVSDNSLPLGSPPSPLVPDPAAPDMAISLEATETLKLPSSPVKSDQRRQSQSERVKGPYYFYQASTGQHMYLHSLNAHCLTHEYGGLGNSPDTIKASIVSIERCFMTQDVRKRLPYLNHTPLTSEFYVVELKLAPPVVSKEILKQFQSKFDKKRKARLRKLKDEKMQAKKHEVEHKKSYGIYPEMKIPLSNLNHFPSAHPTLMVHSDSDLSVTLKETDSISVASSDHNSEDGSLIIDGNLSPKSTGSEGQSGGARSFAQMLKEGKSVPQSNVWGRSPAPTIMSPTSLSSASNESRNAGDGSDGGEDLPAPSYNASMSHAIEQAMNTMDRMRLSIGDDPDATPVSGKKKRNRGQKILFATTMARKN